MGKCKTTSKEIASLASKILRGKSKKEEKAIAGSALSQRQKNHKHPKNK